jgi:hypothetical protein
MASFATDSLIPLTLSEQLNAMLSGWLDRHAPDYDSEDDGIAGGIITVADRDVAEVEAFCAQWDMSVRRTGPSDRGWAVLMVEGAALPVRGFTEITVLYRR